MKTFFKYFFILVMIGAIYQILVPKQSRDNKEVVAKNPEGTEKVTPQLSPKQEAIKNTTLDFDWSTGGFGSVMMADFKIKNNSQYNIKDLVIVCISSANSGTVIDRNKKTLYEAIPAGKTKSVTKFNMGFLNSQASKTGCGIQDLTVE